MMSKDRKKSSSKRADDKRQCPKETPKMKNDQRKSTSEEVTMGKQVTPSQEKSIFGKRSTSPLFPQAQQRPAVKWEGNWKLNPEKEMKLFKPNVFKKRRTSSAARSTSSAEQTTAKSRNRGSVSVLRHDGSSYNVPLKKIRYTKTCPSIAFSEKPDNRNSTMPVAEPVGIEAFNLESDLLLEKRRKARQQKLLKESLLPPNPEPPPTTKKVKPKDSEIPKPKEDQHSGDSESSLHKEKTRASDTERSERKKDQHSNDLESSFRREKTRASDTERSERKKDQHSNDSESSLRKEKTRTSETEPTHTKVKVSSSHNKSSKRSRTPQEKPKIVIPAEPAKAVSISPKTPELPPVSHTPPQTPPLCRLTHNSTPDNLIRSMEIIKSLEGKTDEVDEFLIRIQGERLKMEEQVVKSSTPLKPSKPKPLPEETATTSRAEEIRKIDESVKEKPSESIDMFEEPTERPVENPKPAGQVQVPTSSDTTSSSSSTDSNSSSSGSTSSESSDSEDSDSTSGSNVSSKSLVQEESKPVQVDQVPEERLTPPIPPNFKVAVDITSTTRSPVMMKIQSKPKVSTFKSLVDDDEEETTCEPNEKREASKVVVEDKNKPEVAKKKEKPNKVKESESSSRSSSKRKMEKKASSSSRRRRRRSVTPIRLRDLREKRRRHDRRPGRIRSRSRPRKGEKKYPRNRSISISRSNSRSRSRSLSRERRKRKRSPWRPPQDIMDSYNSAPSMHWGDWQDSYFPSSRSYYNNSYDTFEGGPGLNSSNYDNFFMENSNSSWNAPTTRGPLSPYRMSLDDRINNVLNGVPYSYPPPSASSTDPSFQHDYDYVNYNHEHGFPPNPYLNPYGGGDNELNLYPPAGYHPNNLLTIPCEDSSQPFAQKGNVIEVVPSSAISNNGVPGYQDGGASNVQGVNANFVQTPMKVPKESIAAFVVTSPKVVRTSQQRKALREKKRMEKTMRKKKLELELKQLLSGGVTEFEISAEDLLEKDEEPEEVTKEKSEMPPAVVYKKVVFSDGVLPGDGTSDSAMESSEDSNGIDITEMTANQLKKLRKKKRKRKEVISNKENELLAIKQPESSADLSENGINAEDIDRKLPPDKSASILEDTTNLGPPPPPMYDPPSNLKQPSLKREVLERPKKLLYFNTLHRERRMDFFSIFVPPAMFIKLCDPRLMRSDPNILNRRRIPPPIYPPNIYPPPPQPYAHLPPVAISGGAMAARPAPNPNNQIPGSVVSTPSQLNIPPGRQFGGPPVGNPISVIGAPVKD